MSSTVQDITLEEEDIMIGKSSNAADAKFDLVIGTIEDIIMEPKFQQIQEDFMNKNYKHFEDSDENKLIYTTIHKEYINLIEKYLENQLKKRIENFSMNDFMSDLMSRRDEIEGEIFEILLTFEDFIEFKQLMLSHKASKEGKSIDLGLCIQSINFGSSQNSSRQPPQQQSSSNNNKNIKTPLLDKTQVDHMDSDQD